MALQASLSSSANMGGDPNSNLLSFSTGFVHGAENSTVIKAFLGTILCSGAPCKEDNHEIKIRGEQISQTLFLAKGYLLLL